MKYLLLLLISIGLSSSCIDEVKTKNRVEAIIKNYQLEQDIKKSAVGLEKLKCFEENGVFILNADFNTFYKSVEIKGWSCIHTKNGRNKFKIWLKTNESMFGR